MLKVVVVIDANPQNSPQAVIIGGLQLVPLCLCQRPRLITVDKVWNDEKAINLHLSLR
jgi:hypothetical protein